MTIEARIKEVEWLEKENKLNYEITTLRKQNKKIKDMCANL
jgi:hypothetical protein